MPKKSHGLAGPIPDIHIGKVYDQADPESDIHYETLARLAHFFGQNTPVHRHVAFHQVHVLLSGGIRLSLDEQPYDAKAPLLLFTPPAVPHAFYTEPDSDGHVLTIRQTVVRQWFAGLGGLWPQSLLETPVFHPHRPETHEENADFDRLLAMASLIQNEFYAQKPARLQSLNALGEAFFIALGRVLLGKRPDHTRGPPNRGDDVRLFLRFCDLIELHFGEHLCLSGYSKKLKVSQARLNDICRRVAQKPSKELIHERVLQEARRLLRFSSMPVTEISYRLGFADPAYFSRFFTRRTGLAPSHFRNAQPPFSLSGCVTEPPSCTSVPNTP
jgi:AraC family transcriptional regulator, 4-hydroxyphenylacetate 3-monooxygenase operon regulatory protein